MLSVLGLPSSYNKIIQWPPSPHQGMAGLQKEIVKKLVSSVDDDEPDIMVC